MTLALEESICFYMISFYSDLLSDIVSVLSVLMSEPSPLLSSPVFLQVGYESPHPHMRVPGLPASLQSAASGKPYVSSFLLSPKSSPVHY